MAGQSCFRWVPAMKRGLLCTGLDLVSRRCQAGAVVDVDFKLYCSLKDSKSQCRGKLKAPVVKQKSFDLQRKGGKFFQAGRKRGQADYPSLH